MCFSSFLCPVLLSIFPIDLFLFVGLGRVHLETYSMLFFRILGNFKMIAGEMGAEILMEAFVCVRSASFSIARLHGC